jgi:hypothetical protein
VTLILFILGLALAFAGLRVLFWICAWLAIQPLRATLWILGAMSTPRREASPPALPSNVIQFPNRSIS